MPISGPRLPDAAHLAVAVLAAGRSKRFAGGDKLAAPLGKSLLGEHACQTLTGLDFVHRWVIAAAADHPCRPGWHAAGFEIAVNDAASSGMGNSVALAAQLAQQASVDALLIALADMPLVPLAHFQALVSRASRLGPHSIVASSADGVPMPPAIFGAGHLGALAGASGDAGARHLLVGAEQVAGDPALLIDVDDEAALTRATAQLDG
jgi:CTP:molybdopterin cytidylyltransferase MocA